MKMNHPSGNDIRAGNSISSPYGHGTVLAKRKGNIMNMFEVKLAFGTLYAPQSSLRKIMTVEELNAAYESLEKMRKLNLEIECDELGVIYDHEKCTLCLLSSSVDSTDDEQSQKYTTSSMLSMFGGGGWNKQSSSAAPKPPPKKGVPCLICGNPACPQHSSVSFRKQKVTVCLSCEELFKGEFSDESKEDLMEVPPPEQLEPKIDQMVSAYDRCLLLLCYSAQLIPNIAAQLESAETRNNQLRLGTSSVGIVSGTLGLAGAATILTPFGAPLMLASVALSGGSLVALGGNVAVNYFDEANKIADEIITYNGMLLSILQAVHSLGTRILAEQNEPDDIKVDETNTAETLFKAMSIKTSTSSGDTSTLGALMTGASVQTGLTTTAELSSTTSSDLLSLVSGTFGTAFSMATMALDAHIATDTLKKIRAGNPCDKAVTLRTIQTNLESLPSTHDLETACRHLRVRTITQKNNYIS